MYFAACNNYTGPPRRVSLPNYMTELPISPGDSVEVACSGFFGDVSSCVVCDAGWILHSSPLNLFDFDPITTNTSSRVYQERATT